MKALLGLSLAEIQEIVNQHGLPKFTAKQLKMQHVSVIIKTSIKLIREIYKLCLEDIFLLKMRGVNYE